MKITPPVYQPGSANDGFRRLMCHDTSTRMTPIEQFKRDYAAALPPLLNELCTDGTTAVGRDSLFLASLAERRLTNNAPRGANALWSLRQIFNDLVREFPPQLKAKLL